MRKSRPKTAMRPSSAVKQESNNSNKVNERISYETAKRLVYENTEKPNNNIVVL